MSSFEQPPKSNPGEALADSPTPPAAFGPAASAPMSAAQLEERLVSARLRFMELTARYLSVSNALTQTMKRARETREALEAEREALCASCARYTVLLRARGEPPERTVILIKRAFAEAAPVEGIDNRETLEVVVRSTVTAYYAA